MMINHIITSSFVILFVLLIGTVFGNKISACLKYSLWLLVVIKLLLPFPGLESQFHILNFIDSYAKVISNRLEDMADEKLLYEESIMVDNYGYNETNYILQHNSKENFYAEIKENPELQIAVEDNKEHKFDVRMLLSVMLKVVYFAGVIICTAAIFISNIRFYKALKSKRKYISTYNDKLHVYKIEEYYGACLYGGFSPVIIVGNNTNLSTKQQDMILLHEYVHYVHGDHIWSMIRNLCVVLYWYNPLIWLAASVSRKDSELACDEGTIKRLGKCQRIDYGQTLLEVMSKASIKNNITSAVFLNSTTATGGKDEMKKRISEIAKGRKTNKIAIIITILLSSACIGCTLGEPVKESSLGEFVSVNEKNETENDKDTSENVEAAENDKDMSENVEAAENDKDMSENVEAAENDKNISENAEKEILAENKYIWPTESTIISSTFGERVHPITGEKKVIDYMGITGDEGDFVYAVAKGDIIDVGFDHTLGNYIVLKTLPGEEVTYGHLEGCKVAVGAKVKSGDVIGFMGKTGKATGTFLSISIKVNGEMVDPALYLNMDAQNEIITFNGKEYKKSQLCNATLKWLELSEQDRMLSSYYPPEFMIFEETWGVTLAAENITSTSVTIKCTQKAGEPTGELQTGSWYILETWTKEKGWIQMPYVIDGEIGWTAEAWTIPGNDTCEWKVDWEWLYGVIPSGKYRIGKSIMDFRKSGDFDTATYYAEFEINN